MKCELSWCEQDATWSWVRTAADIKGMSNKRVVVASERHVCDTHRPTWREAVYVPFGTAGVAVTAAATVAKRKHCKSCLCQAAAA